MRPRQLYRHRGPSIPGPDNDPDDRIEITLGCSKNGEHSVKADTTTPLVGDILRVRLVDHEGYMVRARTMHAHYSTRV